MILEPSWREGSPKLVLADKAIPIEYGSQWNVALSGERHCIGHHGSGKPGRTACMRDRLMPEGKEAQCEDCRVKDVSFAAKTGFGGSQQATDLLKRDHAVYLALFSKDTIKVGVSVWERREIRTKEQGATACMIIAKGNGTESRNLERRIHTSLGFTEWVRINTKLAALAKPLDRQSAEELLVEAYEKVKAKFGENALIDPEFIYLRDHYGLSEDTASLPIHQVLKVGVGAVIGGEVAGIIGKSLLLKYEQGIYALDLTLLSGYELTAPLEQTFSDTFAHIHTKPIEVDRQQSLLGLL